MEALQLTYGIPSLVLTVFFLKFLCRSEFKYSFYRILQYDLIVNIMCYANTWFSRFCLWSFSTPMMLVVYENCYFMFVYSAFGMNFYYNMQSWSVILMSVHRLSYTKFIRADEFWKKFSLPIFVFIVFIFVCFNSFTYLYGWFRPKYYDYETKIFMSGALDQVKRVVWLQVLNYLSLTYFLVILITSLLTVYFIKTRNINKSSSGKNRKMMRNLTVISIINSSIFLMVFIWQSFGKTVLGDANYFLIMYCLSDAMTLLLPYILLAFDGNVRRTLTSIIGRQAASVAKNLGNSNARTTSTVNVY